MRPWSLLTVLAQWGNGPRQQRHLIDQTLLARLRIDENQGFIRLCFLEFGWDFAGLC